MKSKKQKVPTGTLTNKLTINGYNKIATTFNYTNIPYAWIVNPKDKGRRSIKPNNIIYLDNNSYFEIELFNPTLTNVLAVININGYNVSKTGLVLRPGERFYLDCSLEDNKKFLFKTYEVEDTLESKTAIRNNGLIDISFYKEVSNMYATYFDGNIVSDTVFVNPLNDTSATINCTNTFTTIDTDFQIYTSGDISPTGEFLLETGRIESGKTSSQKFENVNMQFENYTISSVSYQILPESRRPVETKDLLEVYNKKGDKVFGMSPDNKIRVYDGENILLETDKNEVKFEKYPNFCHDCGNKLIKNQKFCSECGTKIQMIVK